MTLKFPYSLMRLRKGKSPEDISKMYDGRGLPMVQKKYDGHLVQIKKSGSKVRVASRKGNSLNSRLKPIVGKLSKQIKKDGVYIGELISLDGKKHSLSGVQSIVSSSPRRANSIVQSGDVRVALFDKIESNGKLIAALSYDRRLKDLESSVAKKGPAFIVTSYPWSRLDHATRLSLGEGGEGVVVKDPEGTYKIAELGETERKGAQWKIKAPGVKDQSDDFILAGYRKGKEKLIFDVAQYDNGELVVVGKLSGLDKKTEKSVAKKVDKGENVVVEASYQEQLPSGKYRHLAWVRLRPDKPEKSVTMKRKNSKDLEKIRRSVSSRSNPDTLGGMGLSFGSQSSRDDTTRRIQEMAESTNGDFIGKICDPWSDNVFLVRYDVGGRTFYVRIEGSGSAAYKWDANVFESRRTAFLSQLIERKDLVPMLKNAVRYMPYLGTPERYIPDPDRLNDTELIFKWAEWYAGYRLLPWMSFKGWYDNPLHRECEEQSIGEDDYFYQHEYAEGPYIPTVGYDYGDGMSSIRYPIERWDTATADAEAFIPSPWEDHIRQVCQNEAGYAEWITEPDGSYNRVLRPDALTSTVDLLGNLEGPLSPLGSFFDKKAGGLTYYWKGTVDYGRPPGRDVVREAEEEERRSRVLSGPTIDESLRLSEEDESEMYRPVPAEGSQVSVGIAGPTIATGKPLTLQDLEDLDRERYEDEPFLEEPYLYSNPQTATKGFLPGFAYQVFDDDVEMQLMRYYARGSQLSKHEEKGAKQFVPSNTVTITAVSDPGRSIWDTIGFAHETFLWEPTPGVDWSAAGAPTQVTREQKSARGKVAPYQSSEGPTGNPRGPRGQQVDYLEFFVEGVNFASEPLTWVESAQDSYSLASNIKKALARASKKPRQNPSVGIWQEKRGATVVPNILANASRMFSGTYLVDYDKEKRLTRAENAERGIDSDIPGAAFPDPAGNVCKDGYYYQARRRDGDTYKIVYAISYEDESRRGRDCYLVRNSIRDGASGDTPEEWKYARKNYRSLEYGKDIFLPGPDESFVYLDLRAVAELPWVQEEGLLEDFLDEVERGRDAPNQKAVVQWVKPGGERKAGVLLDQPETWYAWVQLPSGAGMEFPMEDLMWDLKPFGEDGTEHRWDYRLLDRPGVDFSEEEKEELTSSWEQVRLRKDGRNPSRNPCLGLHVHSNDLDKIKTLIETRQNPGFVSRMVKKHKRLEEQ